MNDSWMLERKFKKILSMRLAENGVILVGRSIAGINWYKVMI